MLNSLFPASMNGCGRDMSTGCCASRWMAFGSSRGDRVVRQVHMEVEGRHAVEPSARVQISCCVKRNQLVGALHCRRAQAVPILDRNAQAFHQRSSVLAESLLAGDQRVAMMRVFRGADFQVVGNADVVMRTQNEASSFALEEMRSASISSGEASCSVTR